MQGTPGGNLHEQGCKFGDLAACPRHHDPVLHCTAGLWARIRLNPDRKFRARHRDIRIELVSTSSEPKVIAASSPNVIGNFVHARDFTRRAAGSPSRQLVSCVNAVPADHIRTAIATQHKLTYGLSLSPIRAARQNVPRGLHDLISKVHNLRCDESVYSPSLIPVEPCREHSV
jgi:hypothetical protein